MSNYSNETCASIQDERLKILNDQPVRRGQYVLYWMQSSQRIEFNHALEYAILKANQLSLPLIVFFGLTADFPEGNARHYCFMLQGLKEVQSTLKNHRILMVIQTISPPVGIIALAKKAAAVIVDRGYLRIQRDWRREAALKLNCSLIQVESDVVVPVEVASSKEEFSAAAFRPKIHKQLAKYLKPVVENEVKLSSLSMDFNSLNLDDPDSILQGLKIPGQATPVTSFLGGTSQAKFHLSNFLIGSLQRYAKERNNPLLKAQSDLSPYLHFGQISPLYVALEALKTSGSGCDSFLEELVVRRELAINYVFYNPFYDSFTGLPVWAQKNLSLHQTNAREVIYSAFQFEKAETHDKYWNAAQREMLFTGKMHGYMRMYWGKKILEWTKTPVEAFRIALYLNNKHELDGRDPNSFAGVAWCFGKHDRPWAERPVFGNIRYMNEKGLKRKFDADRYAEQFKEKIPDACPDSNLKMGEN